MASTPVYPDLTGRSVLVTGGASGIGRAVVERFAGQGARVVFLDRDATAGAAALAAAQAAATAANGPDPRFLPCDLTDIEALRAAVVSAAGDSEAGEGGIDVLVNNAANDDRHDFAAVTPEYFDERMAVNARHYFFASQAVRAGMVARGRGVIVNLGSIAWRIGFGDVPVYAMAKAAITGLTRVLARELGPDGIRVNCVEPGYVATPRQRELWMDDAKEAEVLAGQPLKTLIDATAVADVVTFLASDASRMCTGQVFTVDGGFS